MVDVYSPYHRRIEVPFPHLQLESGQEVVLDIPVLKNSIRREISREAPYHQANGWFAIRPGRAYHPALNELIRNTICAEEPKLHSKHTT